MNFQGVRVPLIWLAVPSMFLVPLRIVHTDYPIVHFFKVHDCANILPKMDAVGGNECWNRKIKRDIAAFGWGKQIIISELKYFNVL